MSGNVILCRGCVEMQIINSVKKFIVSEDGPTAVEYAVMLALIVIVCLTAVQAIGTNAAAKFQNVADTLAT
jgi:pilus assembly protein Flp/PilA